MRIDPRAALVFALYAFGAALAAIAIIDILAYDLALFDLIDPGARPSHRHRPLDLWIGRGRLLPRMNGIPERVALVGGGFSLAVAIGALMLARVRRLARVLLAMSAVCITQLVAVVALTTRAFRRTVADTLVTVEPGSGLRWLARERLDGYRFDLYELLFVREVAAWSLALTCFTLALATVRGMLHRGYPPARAWLAAAALGLPTAVAAVVLALRWRFEPANPAARASWTGLVELVHVALLATALVLALAAAFVPRSASPPRARHVLPAALVLALGLAAVTATAPHRAVFDAFYPLPDLGARPHSFFRLRRPWALDVPKISICPPGVEYFPHAAATVRLDDAGDVLLSIDGEVARIADSGPSGAMQRVTQILTDEPIPTRFLILLVERRVPVAALRPLLRALAARPTGVVVAGMVVQHRPSADGPVATWNVCPFGDLQLTSLLRLELPPDLTWDAILDNPDLVRPSDARE